MACNILDEEATTSAEALRRCISDLAKQKGSAVTTAYRIGLALTELRARAEAALPP